MNTLQPNAKLIENPPPQRSANQLAALAANGCMASFDELQKIYWARLLHVVQSRLLLDHSDSEDICQEAFVRAFQNIQRFDPRYQFSTWLFTIGLRIGKDFLRSNRNRSRFVSLEQLRTDDLAAALQRATATDGIEVEELWSLAYSVLTPEQYSAMWLRYGEGLPMMEVAKVLQRTQIGVRVILHRARVRLMSQLASEQG